MQCHRPACPWSTRSPTSPRSGVGERRRRRPRGARRRRRAPRSPDDPGGPRGRLGRRGAGPRPAPRRPRRRTSCGPRRPRSRPACCSLPCASACQPLGFGIRRAGPRGTDRTAVGGQAMADGQEGRCTRSTNGSRTGATRSRWGRACGRSGRSSGCPSRTWRRGRSEEFKASVLGRLRAGRAGHLGGPAPAAGPLLRRAGRPAPPGRRRPWLRPAARRRRPGRSTPTAERPPADDTGAHRPRGDGPPRGPEAELLTRFVRMIQVQRGDFNGQVLTVRRDDLVALACILDVVAGRRRRRASRSSASPTTRGLTRAGAAPARLCASAGGRHSGGRARAVRPLPPRAVLRGPVRLLLVRDLDRPAPPDRRLPRRVPRRRRPAGGGRDARGHVGVRRRGHAVDGARRPPSSRCSTASPAHPGARSPSSATRTTSPPSWSTTYLAGGVNRLSFGVQSTSAHVLAALGRTHDRANVERSRRAGPGRGRADLQPRPDLRRGGGVARRLVPHPRRRRRPRPAPRLGLRPDRRGRHARWPPTPTATPTTTTRPTSTSPPTERLGGAPASSGTRSPTGPAPATSAATTSSTGRWASTRAWAAPPTRTATADGSGTSAPRSATSTRSPPEPSSEAGDERLDRRRPRPRGAAARAAHPPRACRRRRSTPTTSPAWWSRRRRTPTGSSSPSPAGCWPTRSPSASSVPPPTQADSPPRSLSVHLVRVGAMAVRVRIVTGGDGLEVVKEADGHDAATCSARASDCERRPIPVSSGCSPRGPTVDGWELRVAHGGLPLGRGAAPPRRRSWLGWPPTVAATLADLHDRGVVHGRLEARRVLVGPAGPLLCGFGPPASPASARCPSPRTTSPPSGAVVLEVLDRSGASRDRSCAPAIAERARAEPATRRPPMRRLAEELRRVAPAEQGPRRAAGGPAGGPPPGGCRARLVGDRRRAMADALPRIAPQRPSSPTRPSRPTTGRRPRRCCPGASPSPTSTQDPRPVRAAWLDGNVVTVDDRRYVVGRPGDRVAVRRLGLRRRSDRGTAPAVDGGGAVFSRFSTDRALSVTLAQRIDGAVELAIAAEPGRLRRARRAGRGRRPHGRRSIGARTRTRGRTRAGVTHFSHGFASADMIPS